MNSHLPVPSLPATCMGNFPPDFKTRYKNRRGLLIQQCASVVETSKLCADDNYLKAVLESPVEVTDGGLNVMISTDGERFLDDARYTEKVTLTVDELLTCTRNPEPKTRLYYRTNLSSQLLKDIAIPSLFQFMFPSSEDRPNVNPDLCRLWVSTAGCVTPLHYDKCHGLLLQLRGLKRFVVFPREDASNLYLHDGVSGPSHASRLRGIDRLFSGSAHEGEIKDVLRIYPKVTQTEPYLVELEPGDVLYTPPGFLHEVTSLTGSVSVTIPWDMSTGELEDRPAYMAF